MTRMCSRTSRWLSLIVAALVVLAACTPAAPPASTSAPSKPAKTQMVLAVSTDSTTVNPFDNNIVVPELQVGLNIHDPLVEAGADGSLVPALATAWERTSPTIIRFQLRKGVKFHNGEDFTAEDVKFTFEEVIDPAKKHRQAPVMSFIDHIEIVDSHTVDMVTKKPEAVAIQKITRQGIASAKYAKANLAVLETKPNGTGPYKFVEWVKDDHLTMEANESHWRGAPPIKRVIWRPIKEVAARVAAVVAGEVDVAEGIPTDLMPQVERSANAEIRSVPAMRMYWMMMVNTKPELPTAKKEVRQAINYAINRDELNKEFFAGKALIMATGIHPKSLGYKPGLSWPYDPAKAKELLAKAGYPNGFTIAMHASDSRYPRDREVSQAIAGQLAKVGITVQVKNLELGQFLDPLQTKTTDPLVLIAFSDADRDRTSVFSTSHGSKGLFSVIAYPELDQFISRAETAMADADRAKVLGEVQDWMMENAPAAYLMSLVNIYAVNKSLKWEPRVDDYLFWRYASFSQ